ncbi:hypothetical protein [Hymenobacter yonginensis]|uniref:DUF4919 domain-containing protein n=1 Tax=Hymenobacter yonginensis TaxID=748197 RepID=A0ABY7PVN8_9BACT|nr:hypothetical protein [Hymenobacter yonginensis]WBO86737.1 hypothetical protein O9Z63_20870 [Hymenobacter yonginensis]
MKCSSFLTVGALLLTALHLQAQPSPELTMEIYNSNIQVITSGIINKSMLDKAMERNGNAIGTRSKASANTRSTSTTGSTAYTSTPSLRQQTVQSYVSRLKSSDPGGAQVVNTAFGPGKYDYGQVYRTILAGTGLRDNDAADALAAYMLMGYAIVHNIQDGRAITVPMARSVRAQVAPLLAVNTLARNRAAQVGEEMKLQTVIVQGGWQSALKQGKLPAYQQGIGNLFKTQYGLDLRALKLTIQGFAQR